MGILLAELGVPLKDADERAAIYLTNALTGWGDCGQVAPPKDRQVHPDQMHSTLLFPEFAHERDAADRVKREEQILVVIGNPPYNSYAGVAVGEERALSEAYRTARLAARPQGHGLNDLYVRFFRLAERQIVERSQRGVVCLISNSSWLDSLSFTGMRERFLDVFDGIWIDNLNGDSRETGKLTPDGAPDPSIFSTDKNREGIQVGTAIGTLVRSKRRAGGVWYREWWGATKRQDLDHASEAGPCFARHEPEISLGLPFRPAQVAEGYLSWPRIPDVFPVFFAGVQTKRDDFLVATERLTLETRLEEYFDASIEDSEMARRYPRVMEATARFDPKATRKYLATRGILADNIVPFVYRPLDLRWVYWEPETRLLGEKSPRYFPQTTRATSWLVTQQKPRRDWSPPQLVTALGCLDLMDRCASFIPLEIGADDSRAALPGTGPAATSNLTEIATDYIESLGLSAVELMGHALAIGHSRAYSSENSGALRQDWARIPMSTDADLIRTSTALGGHVGALLDPMGELTGVPWFNLGARGFGVLSATNSAQLDPGADLGVTARWGIVGKGGITMPS
ncbi:MAG: type ISP restriction/modification enzyme, partial [Coriobacteriia bacterium]|nr:type ISP restriction/modification enzyme [Coriobacteriia bacterium]